MSFKPEVFWLGKPGVSYFPTWPEMKQAMDDIASIGWNVATEAELKDAWQYGANWCASGATKYISPTLGDIGIYYALYPISEEISRSSGGCGSTMGIQVFISSSSGGPTAILPTMTNIGGINVYAIKPNPDFPETIPAGINARWSNENKNQVLITIRGREYIINSFNTPKNFYNSPKTLHTLITSGNIMDTARKGYILPANCPVTSCPGVTCPDNIVEKIPKGYIHQDTCPKPTLATDTTCEKVMAQNKLFKILLVLALVILVVIILIVIFKPKKTEVPEQEDGGTEPISA